MFSALLNHLLQQNIELKQAMSRHQGRVFVLQTPLLSLTLAIAHDGYVDASTDEPEVTVRFLDSAMIKLAQQQSPGVGDVVITGDHGLGMALLPVLGELRYYPGQDLARVFGDGLAGSIMSRVDGLKQQLLQGKSRLLGQVQDYAYEANAPMVAKADFDTWSLAVDELKDDVARLEARLAKLAATVSSTQ
ncbi:MAG: SCP2 domain-containing protein [Neisseriaceae bacterium]|nr:SCP2 domain-containing protein [Neisseriaceae bacterium]MBP6862636.1 SCP2 domain-containing protein [Neisseriaceae bacterium]